MSDNRRKVDAEFKKNAVKISYISAKSIKEVAEDLDISEQVLYRWRKQYQANGEKTDETTLKEENRKLQLELAEVKMERDMLKKAADFFAKQEK